MELLQSIAILTLLVVAAWLLLVGVLWLNRPTRALVVPALRLVPDLLRLTRALLADRTTPRSSRLALVALLVYLASPIDLVPDFIPVIGALDDLIVSALVLRWIARRLGRERLHAAWTGDPAGFELLVRMLGD